MPSGFRDSLHPIRIVVGVRGLRGSQVAGLLPEAAATEDTPVLFTRPEGVEPTKLLRVPASTHGTLPNAPIRHLGMAAMARQETPGSFFHYVHSPRNLIRAVVDAHRTLKHSLAKRIRIAVAQPRIC